MISFEDSVENKPLMIYDKGIDRLAILGENMDFDNPNTFSFQHRSGDVFMPKIKWVEPLKTEIEHFVDCVINKGRCLTDSIHAFKVVEILGGG